MTGSRWQRAAAVLPALALVAVAAACGGDDDDASTDAGTTPVASSPTTTGGTDVAGGDTGPSVAPADMSADTAGGSAPATDGATLRVGYSAWPGWFPLAVAEEQGFFAEAGVDVELTFFVDYISSLDALAAGSIDVNTQTLNDTIFAVAAGSPQRVIATNDNSTGNDAIICDASITSVSDLAGKSIAAEPGVVDHFLLLQGLAEEGMSEADIDFQGLPTAAAAAAFAGGEFDCVGVFAPFTVQALEREGSKVLFSSADFPGAISDHFVATADAVADHPDELQKLVDAWYLTIDWIEANPDEATAIMAAKADVTTEEYAEFAEGTTIFTAEQALDSFEDRAGDPTSLPEMARRINPFLVESGLTEQEADLTDLFVPDYTSAYIESAGD
ncbi:MAG: aliphatic sulfonate ABC transporter substrate-binding protein [Ilumatobacteraceae bacterium]